MCPVHLRLESDAGGVTIRQLARVVTGALETMHTAVMTSLAWQVRNLAVLLPDLGALGEAWRGDAGESHTGPQASSEPHLDG